ncbi:hypothetical protein N7467_000879 [Penicillium canescens]|nr:hypothetical protein N7467_000879 [Penicillium canescens]
MASVRKNGKGKDADMAFGPRWRARGDRANEIKITYTVTVEVGISETAKAVNPPKQPSSSFISRFIKCPPLWISLWGFDHR